jgi:glutaconate CoA-transferase, subunit A
MYSMIQAGSMGLPFIAVRGLLGSDLLKHRPEFKVQGNPYQTGEEVVVTPPLRPDVAVFHALKADLWGNAVAAGRRDDLMVARAARRVVVTAEEIVERELTLDQDGAGNTFLPAMDVDAVIHAPFGAHPLRCGSLYPFDREHMKEYLSASKGEDSFRAYLEKYVFSVADQQEYLERAGKGKSN